MSIKKHLATVVIMLVVLFASSVGFFTPAEYSAYDGWFSLRGVEDPGKDIVVIAMDEKSISKLGPMPWARSVHASLLDNLALAKTVCFDVIFDMPGDPAIDDVFAKAIEKQGHVVLASMFIFEKDEHGQFMQTMRMPTQQFCEKMNGIGYVNMSADKANIVRSVIPIDMNSFGRPYPSFSVAGLMEINGLTPNDLTLENNKIRFGKTEIPVNENGSVLIDFWGPASTFTTYSYSDVLDGTISPEKFKDKIVLIGIWTPTEKQDYYENPYTKGNLVLKGALPLPGIEIHASAIKTFETGRYFTQAPLLVNVILTILIGLITFLFANGKKPFVGFIYTSIWFVVLTCGVYLSWWKMHYWLFIVSPLVMLFMVYLSVTLENFVSAEMSRRKTKALFSRYVTADVVNQLLLNPDSVQLGGTRIEATVLFCDIRGFTTYSEGREPEEVVGRLNDYFTEMIAVVFKNGGMLDKYIGDAIMAIYGAPLPCEDHAEKAVLSAIGMLDALKECNKRWIAEGSQPFDIGFGINTGYIVVGNIGSSDRMDYTAIGEEVNLASRLEGMNKQYKSHILISEATYEKLSDKLKNRLTLTEIGKTQVRGMHEEKNIYSIESWTELDN